MLFFRLLEISVIHPAKCKLPSIREICICMLVYAYENEVSKSSTVHEIYSIPNSYKKCSQIISKHRHQFTLSLALIAIFNTISSKIQNEY